MNGEIQRWGVEVVAGVKGSMSKGSMNWRQELDGEKKGTFPLKNSYSWNWIFHFSEYFPNAANAALQYSTERTLITSPHDGTPEDVYFWRRKTCSGDCTAFTDPFSWPMV